MNCGNCPGHGSATMWQTLFSVRKQSLNIMLLVLNLQQGVVDKLQHIGFYCVCMNGCLVKTCSNCPEDALFSLYSMLGPTFSSQYRWALLVSKHVPDIRLFIIGKGSFYTRNMFCYNTIWNKNVLNKIFPVSFKKIWFWKLKTF